MALTGQDLVDRVVGAVRVDSEGYEDTDMETLVSVIMDHNTGSEVHLYYHNGCVNKSENLQALIDADVSRDPAAVMTAYEAIIRRVHEKFKHPRVQQGAIEIRRNCQNEPRLTLRNKRSWGLATRRRR